MSTNSTHQFTNDLRASPVQLTQAQPGKPPEWLTILKDLCTGALPVRELPAFVWYLLTTERANRLRE